MARARLAAWALAAVMGVASSGAAAALCGGGSAGSGFDDVQDTNNFCNSTQWMKNRGVTLGCTSTLYCPGDVVTRASMALFMNRLGTALTPKLVGIQSGMGTGSVIGPGDFIPFCQTSATDIPAVNYPRQLRARGTISAPLSGSAIGLNLYRVFNGGPYTSIVQTAELLVNNPSGDEVLHWSSSVVPVPPGNSVSVALGLINRGVGTLTLGNNGRCAIEVEVLNANPTSAPFDEQQ